MSRASPVFAPTALITTTYGHTDPNQGEENDNSGDDCETEDRKHTYDRARNGRERGVADRLQLLKHRGYEARALTAGQRGIDIAAWHPVTGHRWAIEAKGSTSSKNWTSRHGAPISESAAYNGVSKALLNAISWTGVRVMRDTSVGIAVPDDRWFDLWLTRVEPCCRLLGIAHFRAGENNQVRVFPPEVGALDNLTPDRAGVLLERPRKMPRSLRRNYPFWEYPADDPDDPS